MGITIQEPQVQTFMHPSAVTKFAGGLGTLERYAITDL